jgi:hypothetical protein
MILVRAVMGCLDHLPADLHAFLLAVVIWVMKLRSSCSSSDVVKNHEDGVCLVVLSNAPMLLWLLFGLLCDVGLDEAFRFRHTDVRCPIIAQ